MSRTSPEAGCWDLSFRAGYPIGETGELALEDYARALTRAHAAEAIRAPDDPAMVTGVHVCAMSVPLVQALITDVEDFARALVGRADGDRLGRD